MRIISLMVATLLFVFATAGYGDGKSSGKPGKPSGKPGTPPKVNLPDKKPQKKTEKEIIQEFLPGYWILRDKKKDIKSVDFEIIPGEDDIYEVKQWGMGSKVKALGKFKLNGRYLESSDGTPIWKIYPRKGLKLVKKDAKAYKSILEKATYHPSDKNAAAAIAGKWTSSNKKWKMKIEIKKIDPYELNGKKYVRFKILNTTLSGTYVLSGKRLIMVSGSLSYTFNWSYKSGKLVCTPRNSNYGKGVYLTKASN